MTQKTKTGSKRKTTAAPLHRRCSSRTFRVGDCIILNDAEQPCARMIVVVTADDGTQYECQYLNADPAFDSYCKPPMNSSLSRATKVEDFGVVIRAHAGQYWCEQREESKATYSDGKPRKWQEYDGPVKHRTRPHLADLVWPF